MATYTTEAQVDAVIERIAEEFVAVRDGAPFRVVMSGDTVAEINAAYAEVVALGGGVLYFARGTYTYTTDIEWESNIVSIVCAGSGAVTFQAVGTAEIIAHPTTLTVTKGPLFYGFTVRGDAASPAGAVGIRSGDITGSTWRDIVIENFDGVGSVGLDLDNALAVAQTERNTFEIRLDNNAIGVRCRRSSSDSGMISFGSNIWELQLLVNDGQVGFLTEDNVLLYHNKFKIVGANIVDAGTLFHLTDTSQILNGEGFITGEQTAGTGGIGVHVEGGAAFGMIGHRTWSGTLIDLNDSTLIEGGTFAPTLRQLAGVARVGNQYMVEDAGVIPNFIGSEDARMVPVIAEQLDALYGSYGFLCGNGIISPYSTGLDVAGNGQAFYAVGVGDTQGQGRLVGFLDYESNSWMYMNDRVIDEPEATRTISLSDNGATIYCLNAAGCTITIPDFATAGLPKGFRFSAIAIVGGTVTLVAGGTTTLVPPVGEGLTAKSLASKISALCTHSAASVWIAGGKLAGPPSAHASTHANGGSDELALDGSQITTGTIDPDRVPSVTGTAISALPVVTSGDIVGDDLFVVVADGVTSQITATELSSSMVAGGADTLYLRTIAI